MLSSTFRICLESALCAAPHPAGVCSLLQPCGSQIAEPLVSTGGFAVAGWVVTACMVGGVAGEPPPHHQCASTIFWSVAAPQ